MAEQDKPDRPDPAPAPPLAETELSAKLRQLDARLTGMRQEQAGRDEPKGTLMADGSAMARGMKLVAEFVAGIAAGGMLGWLIDRFTGIQPFGLLIGLMFGFAAGLRNLYRATQSQSGSSTGPTAGPPR